MPRVFGLALAVDALLAPRAAEAHVFWANKYDEAMADYRTQRDEASLPIYEFTTQLATLEPPPPEMQALLAATTHSQAAMDGFVSVTTGSLSPAAFFDPGNLETIFAAAAAPPALAGG